MINPHFRRKHRSFVLLFCWLTIVLLAGSCNGVEHERDKIVFRDSVQVAQDSIVAMQQLMDSLSKGKVHNIFFDNEEFVFVNNIKIGRIGQIDSIEFIDSVQQETGFTKDLTIRFLTLSLSLRDNHLDGCFRNVVHDVIFFVYKQTFRNEWNDVRYIVIADDYLRNIKNSTSDGNYVLMDRKDRLLLMKLPPKK